MIAARDVIWPVLFGVLLLLLAVTGAPAADSYTGQSTTAHLWRFGVMLLAFVPPALFLACMLRRD